MLYSHSLEFSYNLFYYQFASFMFTSCFWFVFVKSCLEVFHTFNWPVVSYSSYNHKCQVIYIFWPWFWGQNVTDILHSVHMVYIHSILQTTLSFRGNIYIYIVTGSSLQNRTCVGHCNKWTWVGSELTPTPLHFSIVMLIKNKSTVN